MICFPSPLSPTNPLDNRNRVVLADGTFINASWIRALDVVESALPRPLHYIATQGPLAATVHDFWQMIHEYHVRTIVMLANVHEDSMVRGQQGRKGGREEGRRVVVVTHSSIHSVIHPFIHPAT